jgi:hypothetical protein
LSFRSYDVARKLDLASSGNGLDADGVKLFCGAMGKHVADRAIQVGGCARKARAQRGATQAKAGAFFVCV